MLLPINFSWLLDSKLAGSGLPRSFEEIEFVKHCGILSIVTMTEERLPESWVNDLEYLHVPTKDFSFPGIVRINEAVDFIHNRLCRNKPVLVHCNGGTGRTGMILACYLLKYHKYIPELAIEKIRRERPNSIRSEIQQIAINLYYLYLQTCMIK